MITRLAGRCLAAALAIALVALPAHAQKQLTDLTQTQQDELYCVYNDIADGTDFDVIAESYVYTDQSAEDSKKADAALAAATGRCAAKYGWTQDKKDVASNIGFYGTAVDYLTEDLFFSGVDDKDIDKVFAILDTLSDADLDAFYNGSWMKNEPMKARLVTALKGAGVPNDDYMLETGQYVLEASVFAADSLFEWIDTYVK